MLNAPSYYRHVIAQYKTIDVDSAACQILDTLCKGEAIAVDPRRSVYVNSWRVNGDEIYHKHPEFVGATDMVGDPVMLEWDLLNRTCTLCGAIAPATIWILHKFYAFC